MDEYQRGTPRTSLERFFDATRDGNFETAAKYLDLSSMPHYFGPKRGPELARQLKVILERPLDIDLERVSADPKGNTEDGLNASQEVLGRLKTPQRTVSIHLERLARDDGVMVLLDKPYRVGQRIVVKCHDGVVEEIGLRSTRMRLLTGHQTTIPNEQMASTDIENIDRRPNIRRLFNIAIRYDTPLEKVDQAVSIIQGILDSHEGMDPELTPRVYFNEFNRDSLNIIAIFWYHPPDYWAFMDLCQRLNRQIIGEFEQAGIKFALPSKTIFTESTVPSGSQTVSLA
jgi:hypothetical protein